ncbi:MAG: DUF4089 domain-containing protein [Betaproteobacteria bacterium]|nr:DUF4089 domain-containing protein [Betaproteobacteria bacterium]
MSDTPTDAGPIDEGWVRQATRLVGLQITPAQMPGVLANLRRTAEVAAIVNAVELDPVADESGPVWRP